MYYHSLCCKHLNSASDETTVNNTNLNYSSTYAFVKFYSARAAKKAKENINARRFLDGQVLKVSFPEHVLKGGVHCSAHIHESKYFFAFACYDPSLFNLIRCL